MPQGFGWSGVGYLPLRRRALAASSRSTSARAFARAQRLASAKYDLGSDRMWASRSRSAAPRHDRAAGAAAVIAILHPFCSPSRTRMARAAVRRQRPGGLSLAAAYG